MSREPFVKFNRISFSY